MTPNDMEILIHHYCSPLVHPRSDAPAVQQAIQDFVNMGVLAYDPDAASHFRVTNLGQAWLKAALNTPLPCLAYIDANGKVIE